MTKAKQKEKALDKIEARIRNMSNAQDLMCLELYDAAISSMLRLTWQLDIITREERDNLEIFQCENYFATKKQLEGRATA